VSSSKDRTAKKPKVGQGQLWADRTPDISNGIARSEEGSSSSLRKPLPSFVSNLGETILCVDLAFCAHCFSIGALQQKGIF
jgi:hypothetical protein